MVLEAWDAFIAQAEAGRPRTARPGCPGWRAQEICAAPGLLGREHRDGRPDRLGPGRRHRHAARRRRGERAGHGRAPRRLPRGGARRRCAATARPPPRYLAEEPAELDTAPTVSVVGRIPLLSVVLGQAYELAVHGLDLVVLRRRSPAAGRCCSPGLAALVDVTGGAGRVPGHHRRRHAGDARRRLGVRRGRVRLDGAPGGRGRDTPAPPSRGRPQLLLEAASGPDQPRSRRGPPPAEGARRRRPAEARARSCRRCPGIPGGPILQLAARTVGGARAGWSAGCSAAVSGAGRSSRSRSARVGQAAATFFAVRTRSRGSSPRCQQRIAPLVERDALGQQLGAQPVAGARDRVDRQPGHRGLPGTGRNGRGSWPRQRPARCGRARRRRRAARSRPAARWRRGASRPPGRGAGRTSASGRAAARTAESRGGPAGPAPPRCGAARSGTARTGRRTRRGEVTDHPGGLEQAAAVGRERGQDAGSSVAPTGARLSRSRCRCAARPASTQVPA